MKNCTAMLMVLALGMPVASQAAGLNSGPIGTRLPGSVLEDSDDRGVVSYCTLPTPPERKVARPLVNALITVGETEPNNSQGAADAIPLGFGVGQDVAVDVTGTLTSGDQDWFNFNLNAGDILGVNRIGGGFNLSLFTPAGAFQMGSNTDASFIYPPASPLPGGGNRALAFVAPTTGNYALRLLSGTGAYTTQFRVFRPVLEGQEIFNKQILFLDFDGATVNAQALFGQGNTNAVLSPLSSFLAGWGLSGQQNAVIDAILAAVAENFNDVGMLGNNGNFIVSGVFGEYEIEIRNSRDHADPFGQPNVSRVIVGGTIAQLGISTIGIAQDIDPGNFETTSSAVVLLDLLSAASTNPNSLNQYPIAIGASKIDLVGVGVGNIVAHEAGHFYGNFHTSNASANQNIMDQGGNLANLVGVGPDGIWGTADDVDVDFGVDNFANEGFTGQEDTLNVIAFGLSTGTLCDVLVISNASFPLSVNGTYTMTGMLNGKPFYNFNDNNLWWTNANYWNLHDDNEQRFTHSSDTPFPPASGWLKMPQNTPDPMTVVCQ